MDRNGKPDDQPAPQQDRNGGKPSWRVRRTVIFTTLVYCLASASYAQLVQGPEMVQATWPSLAAIASAVIASYVFGAAYEDVNTLRHSDRYGNYNRYYD